MKLLYFFLVFLSFSTAQAQPDSFRTVIAKAQPELKSCYEEHLKIDSGASGKIVLRLIVDDHGKLISSSVIKKQSRWMSNAGRGHESKSLNAMAQCLRQKLKELKFPASAQRKTTKVDYPFVFGPR